MEIGGIGSMDSMEYMASIDSMDYIGSVQSIDFMESIDCMSKKEMYSMSKSKTPQIYLYLHWESVKYHLYPHTQQGR